MTPSTPAEVIERFEKAVTIYAVCFDASLDKAVIELANSRAALHALLSQGETQRQAKDEAYTERNRLVALLSRLWPSHLAQHPDSDAEWSRDWMTIVCIHSPAGQLTWHVHDSHRPMFRHLVMGEGHWDGHTTEEKYRRVDSLAAQGETLEARYRAVLWLNHGHQGQYGDDGEMQCAMCMPNYDYKRMPLETLEATVIKAKIEAMQKQRESAAPLVGAGAQDASLSLSSTATERSGRLPAASIADASGWGERSVSDGERQPIDRSRDSRRDGISASAGPTAGACANCGHAAIHDSPSNHVDTVGDACRHPGCNCGFDSRGAAYAPTGAPGPEETRLT